MIQDDIRQAVFEAVKKTYPKVDIKLGDIEVEKSQRPELGDWATNIAFKVASQVKGVPGEIGNEITFKIVKPDFINQATNINGYINFQISSSYYIQQLAKILKEKGSFGQSQLFENQKVQVEFISANPTGPLTLANGRGGFSGDVLANVFKKAGAEIQKEYYVNDGGNQVKILGESVLVASGLKKGTEDIYKGSYIDDWAKNHKEKVKKYKNEPFKLGQEAAKDFLENLIKPAVFKMGIKFDNWFLESKMVASGEVEKSLEYFKKKDLAYKKDGALWFKTTKFGDDKDRVLVKSDGENTYFANDAAYHLNKFQKRKFDKVINFWGADHHGYVGRMKAIAEAIGAGEKLDIIIMQLVRLVKDGKEFKMSKRAGTYVTMDDLLELIGGSEKSASDVSRFFFLSRDFSTHMDFDLDLAKERSEKNPVFYVKYAYARLSGILRRANSKFQISNPKLDLLEKPEEIELIKTLIELPEVIEEILKTKDYPVHLLPFYARKIAEKFHNFYEKCRVIDESNLELTSSRLKLVEATKIILGIVMRDLIGIEAPEKM